jgi:hypothetical protein
MGKNWVVKCNEHPEDGNGWHWRAYFESLDDAQRDDLPYEFGGDHWIHSARSIKHIREDVLAGDLVVCYQTDHRGIVGLTRLNSNGRPDRSGLYNLFDLIPAREAFPFLETPLTIKELRESGCDPECFGPGTHGTVFPVSSGEFQGIVSAIAHVVPGKANKLHVWLSMAGIPTAPISK